MLHTFTLFMNKSQIEFKLKTFVCVDLELTFPRVRESERERGDSRKNIILNKTM